MIGLDTNISIRYLTQDDLKQSKIVANIFETQISYQSPGFISLIVLIETIWVLKSIYQQNKEELCLLIAHLLTTKQLLVEKSDLAYKALKLWEKGNGDYSDALIIVINQQQGCIKTLTFDKKAKSLGMI